MSGLLPLAALTLLLFLLDRLYRVLHPVVDLERACLVGASALAALLLLARIAPPPAGIRPLPGALAIFASAFGSVLLIQAGALVSQSALSALVHVLILAAMFAILDAAMRPARAGQRRAT